MRLMKSERCLCNKNFRICALAVNAISATSVKIKVWMAGHSSGLTLFLLHDFLWCEVSQERSCSSIAELTIRFFENIANTHKTVYSPLSEGLFARAVWFLEWTVLYSSRVVFVNGDCISFEVVKMDF